MRMLEITATALALFASSASAQPAQFVVHVWSFGFSPNPIHLAAGREVAMIFVNQSGSSHDFTAPGFFQNARILSGGVAGDEVKLSPHETRTVSLVPARGSYQAHCSHFLHKQMGMSEDILVD